MTEWLLRNSLWLVGLGLMLASSGIDGAYMERWNAWRYGGYVLNTVADLAGMALTYWYGRLQQDRSRTKRRLSAVLLGAETVAVLYSWFFGWRQLLIVLPATEGDATRWVAPIAAGFIPLLLAFVGYAQSLLAGRIHSEAPVASPGRAPARTRSAEHTSHAAKALRSHSVADPAQSDASDSLSASHRHHACPHCGRSDFASQQAVSAHLRWCDAYKRESAQ